MADITIACPKCGASLTSDSLFCRFCGTAVTDVTDILKEQTRLKMQQDHDRTMAEIERAKKEAESNRIRSRLKSLAITFCIVFGLMAGFILLINYIVHSI